MSALRADVVWAGTSIVVSDSDATVVVVDGSVVEIEGVVEVVALSAIQSLQKTGSEIVADELIKRGGSTDSWRSLLGWPESAI